MALGLGLGLMFIIFIYLIIIKYTMWAINIRNLVLIQRVIKHNGLKDIRNLRICGKHFEDSQYTNGDRYIILYLCI